MKAILLAAALSVALSQGVYSPWSHNLFFGGYNPFIPAKNITNNPYFNYLQSQNRTRPPWGNPFFPSFGARSLPVTYQNNYNCLPDQHQCNGSHSLSIGCLTAWDDVLFSQFYSKPPKFWSKREKIIKYPTDFRPPGWVCNENITAIRIQDRNCNGTGGYAQILQTPGKVEGIGTCSVTIRLYSDGPRKGFNFYVRIFGKSPRAW